VRGRLERPPLPPELHRRGRRGGPPTPPPDPSLSLSLSLSLSRRGVIAGGCVPRRHPSSSACHRRGATRGSGMPTRWSTASCGQIWSSSLPLTAVICLSLSLSFSLPSRWSTASHRWRQRRQMRTRRPPAAGCG
jgi:hypothetical protein